RSHYQCRASASKFRNRRVADATLTRVQCHPIVPALAKGQTGDRAMKIALGTTARVMAFVATLGAMAPAKADPVVRDFSPFFTVSVDLGAVSLSLLQSDQEFNWNYIGDPEWFLVGPGRTWAVGQNVPMICDPGCRLANVEVALPVGRWTDPLIMGGSPGDTLVFLPGDHVTTPDESVVISLANDGPGGAATITVRAEFLAAPVPGPIAGAGLPGLLLGFAGSIVWSRPVRRAY